MYDIGEIKLGDIMICGNRRNRQIFYVHNIKEYGLEMSGICEDCNDTIFEKAIGWSVHRKAHSEEVALFYELIRQRGFKFNLNTGISKC